MFFEKTVEHKKAGWYFRRNLGVGSERRSLGRGFGGNQGLLEKGIVMKRGTLLAWACFVTVLNGSTASFSQQPTIKRSENWDGGTIQIAIARYGTLVISGNPTIAYPDADPSADPPTIKIIVDRLHFVEDSTLTTKANLQIRAKQLSGSVRIVGDRPNLNGRDGASGTTGGNGADGAQGAEGRGGRNGVFTKSGSSPGKPGEQGSDGSTGGTGANGATGANGLKNVSIVMEVEGLENSTTFAILSPGGRGGAGGNGGNGGRGGAGGGGGKGGNGGDADISTSASRGGDGGRGGNGGAGGKGGDGGNGGAGGDGGDIILSLDKRNRTVNPEFSVDPLEWNPGGKGGAGGVEGKGGRGGEGGPGGAGGAGGRGTSWTDPFGKRKREAPGDEGANGDRGADGADGVKGQFGTDGKTGVRKIPELLFVEHKDVPDFDWSDFERLNSK